MITPDDLRRKYLSFFKNRNHSILPSASLVPENDSTTLFTGSGMQPLVPYLLGKDHPQGKRLVNSQKCFRAVDIEEVGDNRHTTFFEMLGNWSLGDYYKEEQLSWFFEFLTQEIKLDPSRLYVTVFRGNKEIGISRDEVSAAIWQRLFNLQSVDAKIVDNAERMGLQKGRIFSYGEKENWWSRSGMPQEMPIGEPGGPSSEVFFDFGADLKIHENSPFSDAPCHVNCDCGRFFEIGNSVFMEYVKSGKIFTKLPKKNVDFGGGFERIYAVLADSPDIFMTNLFLPIINRLTELSGRKYEGTREEKKPFRIITDHIRAAVLLASDGVYPSNKDQGYFSRRLIRRSVVYGKKLGIERNFLSELIPVVADIYKEVYGDISQKEETIKKYFIEEEERFRQTLNRGLREFERIVNEKGDTHRKLEGKQAFDLYQSYGFPLEMTQEFAHERGLAVDVDGFTKEKQEHQEKSRQGARQKFTGGLADHSIETTRLHTATHLLHQALRNVLGNHVKQAGSNINAKRLRFDFTHPKKMKEAEIDRIETEVNSIIQKKLPVSIEVVSVQDAKKKGALALFEGKYQDKVKLYRVGKYSVEVCGGPHVKSTSELGKFRITKQESIGRGLIRVKAVLE